MAAAAVPAHAGQPTWRKYSDGVDPRPQRRRRPRAHEPGEHRLAGRQRVAHHLGVEDRLQRHGDDDDPEQRQTVLHERCRAEQELAAADGDAERDHAWSDAADPLQSSGLGGSGSSAGCQASRPSLDS